MSLTKLSKGFVGLGHVGTTMVVSFLAAGSKVLCFVRRPERALTSQVAIAAGVAERRPRTGTSSRYKAITICLLQRPKGGHRLVHKEVRLLQVANNVTARSVAPMLAVELTLQFD